MDGWTVRLRVSGLNVEKLLNAARKQGIVLKSVIRERDRAVTVCCPARSAAAFRALAADKGFEVSEGTPLGLLAAGQWLRKRWGLTLGAVLCLLLMIYALGFVWRVSVENAGPYLGEVHLFLEENGIRPGIRRSRVDLAALRDRLSWRLPTVKWVRTEWRGVTLRVIIEEGTPPPDVPVGETGDVVAGEDGVVKWIAVYAGTPRVKPGDLVRTGQVLIQGAERGENGEIRSIQARGDVMARVWVTVQVRLPMTACRSIPTGRQTQRRVIRTPFFAWSAEDEPDYLTADQDIQTRTIGGAWFPIQLQKITYQEVYLEETDRNPEEVKREGAQAALQRLDQLVFHEETVDKWMKFSMIERDTMEVEASAEVIRQIGRPETP